MVDRVPEADPERIDALLRSGDLVGARAALAGLSSDERFAVVRIRLGLYDGSLPPDAALQQLIQLMRRAGELPGAKALYQEAAEAAYQQRQSSVSHSHPPPRTPQDN
ncbi:MAG TPA: hypothetical protein VER33_23630 [Polyangiaceae bacterium]|nr:hypothetical protein [Polyangiaceae bacterium]